MADTTNNNSGRRPDLEEQLASLKVAGWLGKFGWSFKISERSYQASDGKWVQTPYYRTADLVVLRKLIDRMVDRALATPAQPSASPAEPVGDAGPERPVDEKVPF